MRSSSHLLGHNILQLKFSEAILLPIRAIQTRSEFRYRLGSRLSFCLGTDAAFAIASQMSNR